MPPRKKTKSSKNGGKRGFKNNSCDMISALPDPIICHILSFLPTKYSVRTSALSTRWKYLFTQVPVLDFNDELDGGDIESINHSSFASFVYRVLHLHNVNSTRKFSLTCSEDNKDQRTSNVFSWVSTAIRCNIPDIFVKARMKRNQALPLDLCSSKTLVKLKLEGERLFPVLNESMCLPSLKMLHIVRCHVFLWKLKQISFSACPVLEDLNLEDCRLCYHGPLNVEISLSSLKKLKLRLISSNDRIVLNAPALKFLEYDHCHTSTVSGDVLESLVQARISARMYPGDNSDGIRNLNKMVSNAYNLSLDSNSIKALTLTSSELTRYKNLTRLEFRNTQVTGWRMLPEFLISSPYLETLIFADGYSNSYAKASEVDDALPLCECTCLSLHLKEVEFRCFLGVECEFRLVEYMLKNAKVLDKMILCLAGTLESRYMISQRLLALPRYSKDCQVLVHNK